MKAIVVHATVVAGTTIAFMGLTYFVVPLIFRRHLISQKLATVQVYLFGIGMTIFIGGMTTAGSYALPRAPWDGPFASSNLRPGPRAPGGAAPGQGRAGAHPGDPGSGLHLPRPVPLRLVPQLGEAG